VPSGVGLAWASSNDAVATVDSTGTVTAVDDGESVITASFEYEGQTYSDTCDVTVSDWEDYQNLFDSDFLENKDNWSRLMYIDAERQTFFTPASGYIELHYNATGSDSSVFCDLKPKVGSIDIDTDLYDYRLNCRLWAHSYVYQFAPIVELAEFTGKTNYFSSSPRIDFDFNTGSTIDFTRELNLRNVDAENLFTTQVKIGNKEVSRDALIRYYCTLQRKRKQ